MKTRNPSLHPGFRKSLFSTKSLRLFLEVCASIVGLLIVVVALLLARLSMGPISLDFIIPEVENALKAPQVQISASVEHAQLVWREWKRPFEIELVNVHLQKEQNPQWLKINHIGVSFRLTKLLVGHISLKDLRFYQPHILLEKDEKGEIVLGFGETKPDQQLTFKDIAPLLALGTSHPSLGKLNELRKISIIDANIIVKDETKNQEWKLPKVTFVLKRQINGFRTELHLRPQKTEGSLTLGLVHRLDSSRFDLYANFHNISFKDITHERVKLPPPRLDQMTPDDILNFFNHWNIPLKGQIHIALVPETFQIIEGACHIDIGKGTLNLSLAKTLPFPVHSGNLSFILSPHGIELKNFSLLSEEMLLNLSGKLASTRSPLCLNKLLETDQTLELNGKVEDLLLNHLGALWPQDLAHEARTWLTENLREGTLTKATFSLKGQGSETDFRIEDLKGTLEGEGAEITYLQGLPPAQNVKAQATFDQKGFDIKVLSGNIEHIELQGGHIVISNLDTDDEHLRLDVTATGPLSDILDVINHKPLQYATYGGIDPKKAKGVGKADLHIEFPLLSDLQFKDVKLSLKGAFKAVALERKITENLTAQLTQGELSADLTQDQLIIKGKGMLNQLPSQLTYTQSFKPQELQVDIETEVSFEDFNRFGFDYRDYGRGLTKAKLTYRLDRDHKSEFRVALDTTPATLTFPPLGWGKKPGDQGKLSFVLHFEQSHLSKMSDLIMFSPTYSLQGEILFGPQKTWKTIHLSQFKGPHTNAQLTLHTPQPNVYEISCKGTDVDLEKFLEYVDTEDNETDHSRTDIKLSAQVDNLRLGEDKIFENVDVSADLFLQGKETTWKAVKLRATAGKRVGHNKKSDMAHVAGGIVFDITPGPKDTQTLEVRANDAGKFLKNLTIFNDLKGGYIVVKAKRQGKGPFEGVFKLKEFNVNKVPVLARFAALLSPMGVANLFSDKQTLSMDRFNCDFQFSEDMIIVKKGIGKSISLGFTVDGKIDRKNRIYGLKGNVIPARFLNSILNNIPVIGSLLSGGEGEGLFGIAYSVSGSFDNPAISLNPLSMLAPGFLRKLFQSIGDDE